MYFFPRHRSILEETCQVITAAHCLHIKFAKVYNVILSHSQNTTVRSYIQNMDMYYNSELHLKPTKHLMMSLKCTFYKSVNQFWKTLVKYSEQRTVFILIPQKYLM